NSLLRHVSTKSSLARSAQKSDTPPERSPTNVSLVTLGDVTNVLPSRKILRPTAFPWAPTNTYQPSGPCSWLGSNHVVPDMAGLIRAGPQSALRFLPNRSMAPTSA